MNGGTTVSHEDYHFFYTITLSPKQQSTITLQSARQDKKKNELFSSSKRGTSERRISVQKAELLLILANISLNEAAEAQGHDL